MAQGTNLAVGLVSALAPVSLVAPIGQNAGAGLSGSLALDGSATGFAATPLPFAGDMSFAGWVNATDRSAAYALLGGQGTPSVWFDLTTGGDINLFLSTAGGGNVSFTGAARAVGSWWWWGVTVINSSRTITLYVNGVRIGSDTTGSISWAVGQTVTLGTRAGGSNTLKGGLAGVRAWSRTLSDAEMAGAYGGQIPGGLVGEWLFGEGSGTIAHDTSGQGNAATFHGTAAWSPSVPTGGS